MPKSVTVFPMTYIHGTITICKLFKLGEHTTNSEKLVKSVFNSRVVTMVAWFTGVVQATV